MEKKREITEEQVKEYQMLLAQWMQLPKDALEILNEDMPWRIREWLYVCALDQISGAELKTMKPQGLKKIQDIRAQFLKQKFQDRQEIQTQMNALQKQMEEGIEKQATALFRLQEEVLQVLQYLEQEKQILKEREEQLLEEQRKYKEQFQQMEANRLEEEKSWSLWNRMWKKKQRKTQMCRKRAQMDQFVKQVLEEEKFSQEQKSYLLDCLEQGEEMEEVLYLAKSCLSVEQMERIKQLLSEHPQMFGAVGESHGIKRKRKRRNSVMKIQVQLYLPDQNQGTVWGYGTITLDQLLTFQIRILTCEKGAGIKEAFVSFPRRKQGERWEDLVIVEDSLRNQITEAVREAIRMEITKDLYLPTIEVLHLQVFPQGKKTPLVGEATIRVLGVTVKGILLKRGKYGVFCHMPQYYSEKKGYQDVIYSPSKRLRDAIFQAVLETYQERQKE